MAVCDVDDLKAELAWTDDLGEVDDPLMGEKIKAAQDYVERRLGYKIEERYGEAEGQESVPGGLKHTVVVLAAWWYDRRGEDGPQASPPHWIEDVLTEYRDWTF